VRCALAAACPHEGVDGTRRHAQILVRLGDKIKFRVLDSLSPRRYKLLFWVLGLLLFYTVTGFLILPPIIRAVAVKQLSKQLDREVSFQKVKLNPFALSANRANESIAAGRHPGHRQ
jgi:hypothetical protein